MVIIKYKPTSPGRRNTNKLSRPYLSKDMPFKSLLRSLKKSGGRNNYGRITTRHIGGGHKKHYRLVDFKRRKINIPAKVESIEYDPIRSAEIAKILYEDGNRSYILYPKGLKIGDIIYSGSSVPLNIGNALKIKNIPVGSIIHNIEIKPKKGGQIARSAGSYAQILSREENYTIVRLRSGETRKIFSDCYATIGEVGNSEHMLRKLGKAGAKRWKGVRPTVRGTAMNPIDHPHGGGEGKNFGKHPVSPWGLKAKGKKSRRNKLTEKFIIHHRKK